MTHIKKIAGKILVVIFMYVVPSFGLFSQFNLHASKAHIIIRFNDFRPPPETPNNKIIGF